MFIIFVSSGGERETNVRHFFVAKGLIYEAVTCKSNP